MNFVPIGNVGDGEFKPTAAGIFLASVHRSEDSTNERPKNNIVSSALMTLIVDQCGLQLYPTASINENSLFGYPIKVVKSDWLFAVSIDSELIEHEEKPE